jgi:predicted CoA-binding protein
MTNVAIIGASNDRGKFGNKAVRAYLNRGYRVFPIHPREAEVEGLPAYRSILDVPGEVDRAALYVRPEVGLQVVEEIARKGVGELFFNPGTESAELLGRARALGLKFVQSCAIRDIGEDPGAL